MQPKFSVLYANLSKVMSSIKVDCDNEDGTVTTVSFYRLLLTRVKQEFERHGNDEHIVSMEYAISQANSVWLLHILAIIQGLIGGRLCTSCIIIKCHQTSFKSRHSALCLMMCE